MEHLKWVGGALVLLAFFYTVMLPWEGRFGDCRPVNGMMIPFFCEVSWVTFLGMRPYFRGTVSMLAQDFASPGAEPAAG